MISSTEIANMALGHLGTRDTISDLSTENSVEAREIKRWFVTERDVLLRRMDWNFARITASLASSSIAPPGRWGFAYTYPSDCLKFRRIDIGSAAFTPIGPMVNFEIINDGVSGQLICCNVDQAVGVYTQRIEVTGRFDPEFGAALAIRLAARTALPITNKQDLAQRLKIEAKMDTEEAEVDAANEEIASDPRERVAESISARGYDYYEPSPWPWGPRF